MNAKRAIQAALAGGLIVVIAAVGAAVGFVISSATGAGAVTSTVVETGSSLLAPWFGELGPAYQSVRPDTLVAGSSTDSGTGIKDAEEGLAAIGAADLSAGQVKGMLSIPITVASVAIAYNVPSVRAVHLNGVVLAGMYSGRITRWNDPRIAALNPGVTLPDTAVRPLERSDSSGTTYQFTSYLQAQSSDGWPIAGKTENWPAGTGEQGNNAMVTGCAKVPGCVSYVGVSYAGVAETQYHLQMAALADGAGKYLLPSRVNLAAALAYFNPSGVETMIGARNGYPMINFEFAVVKEHQVQSGGAASIREFLDWAVTTGSQSRYLAGLYFEPLPPKVLALSEQMIAKIR